MEHRDQQFPGLLPDSDAAVDAPPALAAQQDAGPDRVDEMTVAMGVTPGESTSRRDGGHGAHRAKVSWVGKSGASRKGDREGWLARMSHSITSAPPARPGSPPVDEPVARHGEAVSPVLEDGSGDEPDASATATEDAVEIVFVAARPAPEQYPGPGGEVLGEAADVGPRGGETGTVPLAPRRSPVVATVTGVGIGALSLLCFLVGPPAVLVLVSLIIAVAMAECYRALQQAHYRPAAALGLVAAPGAVVAAYFVGPLSIALIAAFMVVASMCWYLAGVTRRSPFVNLGATVMAWAWIGMLGGFAGLLLEPAAYPHRQGLALLLGAAEATVAYDVGGYLFGSLFGKHPMAPAISPKKSWEGLIGGCALAFIVAVALVSQMSPWSYGRGALLGLVVVVVAPLGDLAESMIKRDLGVKDMGNLLPAHGGVLDRVDALLFVLPATYCLVWLLHW